MTDPIAAHLAAVRRDRYSDATLTARARILATLPDPLGMDRLATSRLKGPAMANDAPPLAAVLCEDLARGYRPAHEIARLRRCDETDVHLVRRLFGHDRATLARAAALLRMPPPEPAPAPPPQRTNPDADPALLADIADAAARVAQAKADRDAAIVAARASGHHIRDIAAAAHLAFSSVRHVIERGES